MLGGPKSPPMASRAIFIWSRILRRSGRESKMKKFTRRRSEPGGPCSNRTKDKRYAIEPCCRIAGTCSRPVHASDVTLSASVAASSTFYVWGLPWGGEKKAPLKKNTNGGGVLCPPFQDFAGVMDHRY